MRTVKEDYDLTVIGSVDDRNRLQIPKDIAEVLNIKKGDKITVRIVSTYRIVP